MQLSHLYNDNTCASKPSLKCMWSRTRNYFHCVLRDAFTEDCELHKEYWGIFAKSNRHYCDVNVLNVNLSSYRKKQPIVIELEMHIITQSTM